ncbi:hypothetical protein DL766_010465 [Monosporascus sp. MC13-8B]|uniref:CENP-V/GFA domain-containing protein n=1 Tax=Monosporascus cannonballus TaxID=155416 RepID=A0ABY0H3B7_9PEZI|nr:hypothetical protein DL763_008419 [Monosporascus cannonballus]RYO83784.1 hypothetical protein DL762_005961 [Monosporascus cannonballus]RYP02300.1 hypothetical protein DL766_010465 [Monosporascus sp. MC13-8B]
MEARCQCGAVQFMTPIAEPLALYICHCSDCRRQTSSAFGTSAIFPRFPLPSAELLSCYTRPTSSGHTLHCENSIATGGRYLAHRCFAVEGRLSSEPKLTGRGQNKNVVSVKGGCLEGLDWRKAVHIWTKSAMVPIPEGAETHPEEPTGSGYSTSSELSDRASDFPGTLIGSNGCGEPSGSRKTKLEETLRRITGACELSGP